MMYSFISSKQFISLDLHASVFLKVYSVTQHQFKYYIYDARKETRPFLSDTIDGPDFLIDVTQTLLT